MCMFHTTLSLALQTSTFLEIVKTYQQICVDIWKSNRIERNTTINHGSPRCILKLKEETRKTIAVGDEITFACV